MTEYTASAFRGHPLEASLPRNDRETGRRLCELGIVDAEQLVGVAAIPGMQKRLSRHLKLKAAELEKLLARAESTLSQYRLAIVKEVQDPPFPLGANIRATPESRKLARLLGANGPELKATDHPAINHAGAMRSIVSQGARGTCVGFGVTAMHEYYFQQSHPSTDLSEQFLYWATKQIDKHSADCGTWLAFAVQALNTAGQCREAECTYNPNLPCNDPSAPSLAARDSAAQLRVNGRMIPPSSGESIRSILLANGLVAVCISVFDSWYRSGETMRSGRITMPVGSEPVISGHCVCIVGYQNFYSSPGGGFFIVRNSWGTSWANESPYGAGYGTVPYAYIGRYCTEAATI